MADAATLAMPRVAIVGGGISGLAAAFYLQRARVEYVLFERAGRLGGSLRTERVQGCLVEAGADSFLTAKPWAAELAREAGIGDRLIGSNDATRKTYIVRGGRLVPIPAGMSLIAAGELWPIVTSPLFSLRTKLRFVRELLLPPAPLSAQEDESVASFTRRHFGDEVATTLAAPLLAGVYGGDAEGLSARAVLPALVEMEARHRSLGRALRAARRQRGPSGADSIFTSFTGGMQELVDAVASHLDANRLRASSPVESLRPSAGRWTVRSTTPADELRSENFSHVILALPAYAAAELLRPTDAALADSLVAIPYRPAMTIALGYPRNDLAGLPQGFGFLVPRGEGLAIIACTFVHNKFPARVPEAAGHQEMGLLRAFMVNNLGKSDAEVVAMVRADLRTLLGLEAEPAFVKIDRWPYAMPQYQVGHFERVAAIERMAAAHAGLHLAGNAYRGVGVSDCVREGKSAAESVIQSVAARS